MANNIEDDLKLAIDKLGKGDELALDVGTGRARMAYALAKYGYDVVSIEYDINILKKARESTNLVNGDGKLCLSKAMHIICLFSMNLLASLRHTMLCII